MYLEWWRGQSSRSRWVGNLLGSTHTMGICLQQKLSHIYISSKYAQAQEKLPMVSVKTSPLLPFIKFCIEILSLLHTHTHACVLHKQFLIQFSFSGNLKITLFNCFRPPSISLPFYCLGILCLPVCVHFFGIWGDLH